jgi:hypothetical protein
MIIIKLNFNILHVQFKNLALYLMFFFLFFLVITVSNAFLSN